MLENFKKYITDQELLPNGKVLLAVSGGVDSVVMTHLFHDAGVKFGIAHCNFQLRGDESEADMKFVEQLANECSVKFHSKQFDTKALVHNSGDSTQMVARKLRYDWFEELLETEGYQCLALGQHQGDNAETMLINLIRGTGIKGLHGILPKNGRYIRPLMFTDRKNISIFANEKGYQYREDSSNKSDDYLRNNLRINVIPKLREMNPSFEKTMKKNSEILLDQESIINDYIDVAIEDVVSKDADELKIDCKKLTKYTGVASILFAILEKYGFNRDDVQGIKASITGQSGKVFHSNTHTLFVDRNCLLLSPNQDEPENLVEIRQETHQINIPIQLKLSRSKVEDVNITGDLSIALLDFQMLNFPLTLRKWREGDSFQPLGMSGKKKVSDFLIDEKVSVLHKKSQFVLTSEEEIVWLVDRRIDERYKITDSTKEVYKLEVVTNE